MIPGPDHWWMDAVNPNAPGVVIRVWGGGGRVVNEKGDLYGTAPHRIIRWGLVSIAADVAAGAIAAGWRMRAEQGEDPDFARIERTEAEREAR